MNRSVWLGLSLVFAALAACAHASTPVVSTPAPETATIFAAATATTASPTAATTRAGCGRISVFDVAPRSQDLVRAKLIDVDGNLPGPTNQRTYRVSAGKHTLKVAEMIDNVQFNDLQLHQREQVHDRYKTLEIDVQPNTTYLLAARLVEARRNYILDKTYWQPVVYSQRSEACQ